MHSLREGIQIAILVVLLASLLIVSRLEGDAAIGRRIRSKLLLGIPWGTLVSIVSITTFYLVVQRGFWSPAAPLTIPFTSWSYFYPLGYLTAPFAHGSLGHLTGNVIGFAALGALAEYAFSHFPTDRGSAAFDSWRTNPYVRAFVVFPAGVFSVAVVTSVFAWGPIIGFSGVVFAAAGFSLVRYPIATVVALVARGFLRTVYSSLQNPIVYGSASPSFGPPWWANVAIQGHLLGFLVGATIATLMIARRSDSSRPSAIRIWIGTVAVGSSLTLWALWWYEGPGSYVLYRGLGVVLLLVLGVLLAVAVRTSDSPIAGGVNRRTIAVAVLALPILTMGFVAVPLNTSTVADADVPGEPLEAGDYAITYAEDVTNRNVPAFNISFLNRSTSVNSSGVIVVNPTRQVWTEEISKGRLANAGNATVQVGGLTWRRTVDVRREGWMIAGGNTVYRISLKSEDSSWQMVYGSDPVRASPIIDGRNVSVRPESQAFYINVTRNNRSLGETTMPEANETVAVGGLNFTRKESIVTVERGETRVPIFQREQYRS